MKKRSMSVFLNHASSMAAAQTNWPAMHANVIIFILGAIAKMTFATHHHVKMGATAVTMGQLVKGTLVTAQWSTLERIVNGKLIDVCRSRAKMEAHVKTLVSSGSAVVLSYLWASSARLKLMSATLVPVCTMECAMRVWAGTTAPA